MVGFDLIGFFAPAEPLLFLTTVIYEQPCRCWNSNPDPLARAVDALTTEQPPQHPAVRVLTKSLLSKSYSASTSGFSFGFVFCFLFETVLLCLGNHAASGS